MDNKLYEQIIEALKDRGQGWEIKQEGFYRLRFGGIKRSNKPYPSAPDTHYPLADSTIDKLKPLFVQQLYANDTLAQFVATIGQNPADTQSASEWFDYQLKQCSNFEPEIFSGIDQMLECGSVPVKVYFDVDKGMLCFSSCDPMHVVVPPWTENIQDADWLVHILQISEAQYRANPNYKQDEDFIKSIKGKADSRDSGDAVKADLVKLREGLAYGQNKDQIVLWEVYRRESGKLVVDTISPIRGCDEPVRETFGFPYDHNKLPFFILPNEITKKGYYSPRGIPELLAPYQMALKKMWDGQLQHLDFHGVPTYKNTGQNPLPNAQNYRSRPGGILPPGIEPTQNPPAPIDFDKQMAMTRAIAEERISIPDLGNNQHLTPGGGGQADRVTATQINAVVGLSGQSNDLRARVFRLYLAYGYKMAWDLLVQFKKAELQYILEGEIKQVNSTALHDKYIIMPNGSPDSWNKGGQMQKALMRFQMFKGDPFIKQGELRKTVMELDDSRLVKRLYTDPGAEQEAQAEQQAQEISIMLLGYPAAVSPADDDKTHLMTMAQFVQRRMQQNEPITPELARLFLMHGSQHTEALTEKKDPAVKQISEQLMPVVQILQQISSQPDQSGTGNNVQPPNGAQPGVPSSSPGAAAAPSPQEQADEQAKIEVQKGNLLVNMAKAGMPVNHAEVDKVLAALNLPPLAKAPLAPVEPNRPTGHVQKPQPAPKKEATA